MYVSTNYQSHLIHLIIHRAERLNSLGVKVGEELLNALDDIHAYLSQASDQTCPRLVTLSVEPILTKSGKKIWIAGGDLKELSQLKSKDEGDRYSQLYRKICQKFEDIPVPTISMIDGQVIGGGVELVLATDLRMATTTSNFSFKQTKLGLATGYGGSRRLIELVGVSQASYWLLLGKTIDTNEALKRGFLHEVFDQSKDLERRILDYAQELKSVPLLALKAQKRMLRQALDDTRAQALIRERWLFRDIWMNPHYRDQLIRFIGSDESGTGSVTRPSDDEE